MEKSRRNKDKRKKKNRKEVEMARSMGKKKRGKQRKSNDGKKVFCLWKLWAYCPLLQKQKKNRRDQKNRK